MCVFREWRNRRKQERQAISSIYEANQAVLDYALSGLRGKIKERDELRASLVEVRRRFDESRTATDALLVEIPLLRAEQMELKKKCAELEERRAELEGLLGLGDGRESHFPSDTEQSCGEYEV